MSSFTRTREEQKMLDEMHEEQERLQATHKATIDAETASMITKLRDAGVVKKCPLCGYDQWTGTTVSILGTNLADMPAEGTATAMFRPLLGPAARKAVLWCLVMTCGYCSHVQMFNMEPLLKEMEQADEAAKKD